MFAEMPFVAWLAVGVTGGLASFAMISLLACVIVRQRRHCRSQQVTSSASITTARASITTDLDNEKASVSDSDAESCSPVQDIVVSQSTPDLIGRDGAGCLATGRAPDVIDGAFHLPVSVPLSDYAGGTQVYQLRFV